MFAANCIRALDALIAADSRDFTLIQALWTAAVVAYARSFTSGRVRALDEADRVRLVGNAEPLHDELMRRRNKHIAHQVDADLENVTVAVGVRPDRSLDMAVSNPKDLAPSARNVATIAQYLSQLIGRLAELANEAKTALEGEITPELLAASPDVTPMFDGPDYGSEIENPMGGFYRVLTPNGRDT